MIFMLEVSLQKKKKTNKTKLNANFIDIITKKPEAIDVYDFRLVSQVIGDYKIIAKVLTNRLKRVAKKIILKP
jgi:hypothetical protein